MSQSAPPQPYYPPPVQPPPVTVEGPVREEIEQIRDDIGRMRGDSKRLRDDLGDIRHNVGIIAFWFKIFTVLMILVVVVGCAGVGLNLFSWAATGR